MLKLLALMTLGSLALLAATACSSGSESFKLDGSQPAEVRAAFDKGFIQGSFAVVYCTSYASAPQSSLQEAGCNTLVCVEDDYSPQECTVNFLMRGQEGVEAIAEMQGLDKTAYETGWFRGRDNERACTLRVDQAACVLSLCSRQTGAFACLTDSTASPAH